jgi:hypothetical protein
MKNKPKNSPLERKYLLAKVIQQQFKEAGDKISVWFGSNNFRTDPALEEADRVVRALREIKDDLKPDFQYYVTKGGNTVDEHDLTGFDFPGSYYALRIVLEDKSKLARYLETLEQQLQETPDRYQFVLTDKGRNKSELSLEKSAARPLSMETSSRRCQFLRHLAHAKKPVPTHELVTELRVSAEKIRGLVDAIRGLVRDRFKVPRSSIIQNDQSGNGYAAATIRLVSAATRDPS